MEINIRSSCSNKKINLDKSFISFQTSDNTFYSNLKIDYDVVEVSNTDLYFASNKVINEITDYSSCSDFDLINKILDIIGCGKSFLDKRISDLSLTEKIYLNLLRKISKHSELLVFRNVFLGLDLNNQKKLLNIIRYLIDNDYNILISSNDSDVLYKVADKSIIISAYEITYSDTAKIYSDVDLLTRCDIKVPTLTYITYRAKKEKNVKLFYSKDVRDIIKDIYKHV